MSPERPITPELHLEIFQESYEKTYAKFGYPTYKEAEGFLVELTKRNRQSQRGGEENYFNSNVNQTLNQFNIDNSDAEPYRFIAGSYFGKLSHLAQKAEEQEQEFTEQRQKDESREILRDAAQQELEHEHGEERARDILDGLK